MVNGICMIERLKETKVDRNIGPTLGLRSVKVYDSMTRGRKPGDSAAKSTPKQGKTVRFE